MSSLPARSLIVAPRLPTQPSAHTGNPFTSDGDIVLDCDAVGCGWHWMGPRKFAKDAFDKHHRMFHSDQIGTVLLNQPRQ